MKRIINTFVIFLMIMLISVKASATDAKPFNVMLKGEEKQVYSANVLINAGKLDSKFEPYTNEGRTFVPIREISEALGAKVIWNDKTQSVEIILSDKTVKLKINSNVVYVNGEKHVIDNNSIPSLSTYNKPAKETKTMVPLRFLTESFGYNVDWNNSSKTASISNTVNLFIADEEAEKKEAKIEEKKVVASKAVASKAGTSKTVASKEETSKATASKKASSKNDVALNSSKDSNVAVSLVDSINKETSTVASTDTAKEEVIKENRVITKKIKSDGVITIVLDAGHGGNDPGSGNHDNKESSDNSYGFVTVDTPSESKMKVKEKELTLKVALGLEPKLRAMGYEVIMTRSDDEFVSLLNRAEMANSRKAEIFVSVHFNSALNKDASGIEVLYASANSVNIKSAEQANLAKSILDEVIRSTGAKNRGIKNRPDLVVLNKTEMPAALAELGFISNEAELEKIMTPSYIDKLIDGMLNGIVKYVNNYVE